MDLTLNLGDSPERRAQEIAAAGDNRLINMGIKMGFCMRIKVDEENRGRQVELEEKRLFPCPTQDNCNLEAEERGAISVSSSHMNFAVRGRKKLRLSKEQSAFLEESFKEQNTLNSKLKFVLAKQLDLRPRQIEVWFQNRRARTKLKQMEKDCQFMKLRCEALRDENRRLQKEISDLRSIKTFNTHIPPTTLSICPSCERVSMPISAPPPPPATPR